MTDDLWDTYFREKFDPDTGRPGRRPKTHPKSQLRVVLLDLYVAWRRDPSMGIGVAMTRKSYNVGSRYNAIHISRVVIQLVHHAEQVGLVELWKGNEASGKVSRIWPTEALIERFKLARFGILDIGRFPDEECIVLSAGDGTKLEYEDTAGIISMRTSLQAYNRLLHCTLVDIPGLDQPFVELPSKDGFGVPKIVRIDQNNKLVKRIFYRGDWKLGGRFHGGFWQTLPQAWRKQIHLNGAATIEDDYSALHVVLLYGLEGITYTGKDPYELPVPGMPANEKTRKLVKSLVLTAINAKSENSAFQAFRREQPTGSPEKRMTNAQLKVVLSAFKERHPAIAHYLNSDMGVRLMAIDGRITARVIDHFTAKGIPVLTIHDSYIIDIFHTLELRKVLQDAIAAELSIASARLKKDGMGFDEVEAMHGMGVGYRPANLNLIPRYEHSEGYVRRMNEFKKWIAANREDQCRSLNA